MVNELFFLSVIGMILAFVFISRFLRRRRQRELRPGVFVVGSGVRANRDDWTPPEEDPFIPGYVNPFTGAINGGPTD